MQVNRRQFLATITAVCAAGCGTRERTDDSRMWGRSGVRDGEFRRPRAIATTDTELYVIDTTGRVQVFAHNGRYLRGWRMPDASNGTPTGIAFAADGSVIIPDTHYSRVMEFTPVGEVNRTWGTYGTGNEQFIYPTDVAIGPGGEFFLTEYGVGAERLHVFDTDRRYLRQWGRHGDGDGEFSRAMSLTIVGEEVFVADTANHRIQVFSFEGEYRRRIGGVGTKPGELRFPHDIACAPDHTLVVCEYGNNRLSRFTCAGALVGTLGKPGRAYGEFNTPRGVTVSPQGAVFVADTDNDRIQRFGLEDFA